MANTTQERKNNKTPNGGAYSIAYYMDESGAPTDKKIATHVMFIEFDDEDKEIHRAYGTLKPPVTSGNLDL